MWTQGLKDGNLFRLLEKKTEMKKAEGADKPLKPRTEEGFFILKCNYYYYIVHSFYIVHIVYSTTDFYYIIRTDCTEKELRKS